MTRQDLILPDSRNLAIRKLQAAVELLLACAGSSIGSVPRKRVAGLLREEVDWTFVLALARRHGIAVRLYRNLKAHFKDAVPAAVLEQVHGDTRTNSVRAWVLTTELLEILDDLHAGGIRAIPYKGPVLAVLAYGDIALRRFSDLDIIVQAGDFPLARKRLVERGYRPYLPLTPAQETRYVESGHHLAMVRGDGTIMVELHTSLSAKDLGFTLNTTTLWDRLVSVDVLGREVLVPAKEEQLVILCVHGAKHHWSSLGWICDVAELLRSHPALDWPLVLRLARETHSSRPLLLGLRLANTLLDALLPPKVCQMIEKEPRVKDLASEVCAKLFTREQQALGLLERHRFYFRVRERAREGVRPLLSDILTPSMVELTRWPLPPALSFVYYVIRPVRLTIKYLVRFLTRVLRRPKTSV